MNRFGSSSRQPARAATRIAALVVGILCALPAMAAHRDRGANQPGAAGNRGGADAGFNQPGAAGNRWR